MARADDRLSRPGLRRAGLAAVCTGLVLVVFVALGGTSYAQSAVSDVVHVAKRAVGASPKGGLNTQSADTAQYGGVAPIKHTQSPPPPPPPAQNTSPAQRATTSPPKTSGLPFTGMSLLLPLLGGIGLVGGGLALRRAARERRPSR
jgi:hypothetical protein